MAAMNRRSVELIARPSGLATRLDDVALTRHSLTMYCVWPVMLQARVGPRGNVDREADGFGATICALAIIAAQEYCIGASVRPSLTCAAHAAHLMICRSCACRE